MPRAGGHDGLSTIERYRISSIEPNLLEAPLIDFVADSEKFQPHFHIPLQSGSDAVLSAMRRRYRTDLYRDRLAHIVDRMPDAGIGIDVIVGFPGETEAEFAKTRDFLLEMPASYLHVFTYSERPKTTALRIEEVVPAPERKARNKVLTQVSLKKQWAHAARFEGRVRPVLLEGEVDEARLSVWIHARVCPGGGGRCGEARPWHGGGRDAGWLQWRARPGDVGHRLTWRQIRAVLYPNLYFLFQDLFGIEIAALKLVNSFGPMVAFAFRRGLRSVAPGAAAQGKGWAAGNHVQKTCGSARPKGRWRGCPAVCSDSCSAGRSCGCCSTRLTCSKVVVLPNSICSAAGYPLLGVLVRGHGLAALEGGCQAASETPEQKTVIVHPWERTGNVTLVRGLSAAWSAPSCSTSWSIPMSWWPSFASPPCRAFSVA